MSEKMLNPTDQAELNKRMEELIRQASPEVLASHGRLLPPVDYRSALVDLLAAGKRLHFQLRGSDSYATASALAAHQRAMERAEAVLREP